MFWYLHSFSLNNKLKMSIGIQEFMPQMFAVRLKVLLNAKCKVIYNAYSFLLGLHCDRSIPRNTLRDIYNI